MAFSTQKDFFNVPFLNENYELGCKKACVKLKSYESTEDTRAWASDKTKQSKFLSELVTCTYPINEGEGDVSNTDRLVALRTTADDSSPGSVHTVVTSGNHKSKQSSHHEPKSKEIPASFEALMTGGDSLLQCANIHLAEYQKLMKINTTLEKQLEVSREHLQTAKQENTKILEVLANKLDSNTAKDFYNKIQKFTTAGKFSKSEENEMLQIYQKLKNINKSYEILQAENNYLRRLIEKLTNRLELDNITIQPEQSKDIGYLQNEVNSLRKECILLRQIEDDWQRAKQQQPNTLPNMSEQDAENIKIIIKERNSLREKCKSLRTLEKQVARLEFENQDAKKVANDLNSSLVDKTQYINAIEGEMQNMQKYYKKQEQDSCLREEWLKAQLEDLKDEFVTAKCEAQKANLLAMEVSCLRNELLKRDLAINDYDCQYKQLMDVVNELQSVKLQGLHDNQTQTCTEQTDELAFYTCATLEEIFKELKRKGCFDNEIANVYGLEPAPGYIGEDESEAHCCTQIEDYKQQIIEMKKQMRQEANCQEICEDALERLRELETANTQLLHDNQELKAKLIEAEDKLDNMLKKLEKLDDEINKNGQEAIIIGKSLEENIALVKNISDVQLKNEQLANAVSAINSRDDEKIIDDLRRQLEEELIKLRKCQQDNASLSQEVKQRDMSIMELKELNNELVAENNKLKNNVYSTQSKNKIKEGEQRTDETKYKEAPPNLKRIEGEEKIADEEKKSSSQMQQRNQEYKETPINLQRIEGGGKIADEEKKSSSQMQQRNREYKETPPNLKRIEGGGKIADEEKKSSNQMQQRNREVQNLKKSPSNKQRPIRVDQEKLVDFTDSDGFATSSTSREVARKNQKVTKQKTKDTNEIKTSVVKDTEELQLSHARPKPKHSVERPYTPSKTVSAKQIGQDQGKDLVLDEFVNKKSDSLKLKLQKDHGFEKEFRKILEEFILECSFYFCHLYNSKSKLYIICHKLCHNGIDILNFQELAYIHKKIYNQADKLLPGCMLDMILTEHREQVKSILTTVVMPRLIESKKLSSKTAADENVGNDGKKCCSCRNELCCNNSEEMLKEKVSKLEKDIGIAREYLETLRNIPMEDNFNTDNDNSTDTNNSTYRACSPVSKHQKLGFVKHVKKLKTRTKNN